MAEQGTGQEVVGTAEVRMGNDVEELSPETKPHPLGEAKLPLQSKLQLRSSQSSQHIASETTLLPCGRWRKSRLIDDFAAGILRPIKLKRHSCVYVWAV